MENKAHNGKEQVSWKSIVQGFVSNMFERLGDNVSQRVRVFAAKLKKRAIGGFLMLLGAIFLLAAVAILINSFLGNQFQWVGWSAVGIVIVATGYVITKE